MDYINDLYELCETISNEIKKANEKIRSAGGELSGGDYDTIDKLTHALKSIKATIKMMEEEEEGYSGNSYNAGGTSSARGGYSREGGSYRGYSREGNYARRGGSSRGGSSNRYANRGYSRDGGFAEELRGMIDDAPNEAVRRDMQKLLDKVETNM